MSSNLGNRILLMISAVCLVVFLFYVGFTSGLIDRQLRSVYQERGLAALQASRALIEALPTSLSEEEVEGIMGEILDDWGASYIVYPSNAPDRAYVTTHKFGTLIVGADLVDSVLKRGYRGSWKASSRLIHQDKEHRISIEQLPVIGEFYDFSLPLDEVGGFTLHMGFSRKGLFAHVRRHFVEEILLVGVVLVVGLFLLYLLIRRLFRPLDQLMNYSRKLGRRELDAFCLVQGGDEPAQIANALRLIVSDLRTDYDAHDELKEKERRMERQVSYSLASLHALLDQSLHGIVISAPSGEILLVNRLFCRFAQQEETSLLGRNLQEIELVQARGEVTLPDGRIVHCSAMELGDQGGEAFVVREVTAEHSPEKAVDYHLELIKKEIEERRALLRSAVASLQGRFEAFAEAEAALDRIKKAIQ